MMEESADNKRSFRKLTLAIDASYGRLSLLMALSDNWKYRNQLIEQYETELRAKGTRCYRVKLDQQRYSLKQCLFDLTQQEPDLASQNAVVTVLGADELLSVRLRQDEKTSQEKLFFSLQWTREALRQFQVPVVLWLTPQIAGQLARAAPDFWSWRGGVFEFSKPIAMTLTNRPVAEDLVNTEETLEDSTAAPEQIAQQIAELEAQDPESPLLASLYMELGAAYKTLVRYADAAKAYEQAVKLRESQLGAAHVDTATSLNELALLYESMGRYSEAEPLLVRSLEIRETHLGAEHPYTATSLNNLALLYESMGRYSEAEPLYVRAIEIDEKALPSNHPQGVELDKRNFRGLLKQVIEAGKTDQLSDHPLTQAMLKELQTQQGETPANND